MHPVDGSLLVWVADFLDEYQPGAFRQAQVSFSSRIPNAIPIGDASTMSSNVSIFNSKHLLNINELLKEELLQEEEASKDVSGEENGEGGVQEEMKKVDVKGQLVSVTKKYDVTPIVSMISKHENGTLNLWDVTFSPDTKFCQLLNISHKARVNGHRFRVNEITPHPVLPLLLTTSHHNMSSVPAGPRTEENFCSELILWRVDPIGPISKPGSGGISELARINSRYSLLLRAKFLSGAICLVTQSVMGVIHFSSCLFKHALHSLFKTQYFQLLLFICFYEIFLYFRLLIQYIVILWNNVHIHTFKAYLYGY